MTSRSFDSIASERRLSRNRVTDEDVYNYAIRVGYLSYLLLPRNIERRPEESAEAKEHHSRLSGALSISINSITDVFKDMSRDGPKSVKFPEKLLKVLDTKMQNIAMGKDPVYHDQLIRRTVATFYGQSKEPSFQRNMKENRKIEELILMFVSSTTTTLRKDPQLADEGWKLELNNQVAQFVRILRDCLRTMSHVSPELTARLDIYTSKLVPLNHSDSGYDSGTSTRDGGVTSPAPYLSHSVSEMPLVKTVARLFDVTDQEVQKDINALKRFCTEKAALIDLKTCLKNINAGLPFPGRRDDFESDNAFNHWKATEQAHLSQLMLVMVQFNPDLAKSTPSDGLSHVPSSSGRPTSVYSLRSPDTATQGTSPISSRYSLAFSSSSPQAMTEAVQEDDEVEVGHNFTYIPHNPKKFYRRLLEKCIEYDLKAIPSLPEDQEVSLSILSPKHLEVLNECALRWRILQSYRVGCFMDVIRYKYEREDVPLECIPEGIQMISKTLNDFPLDLWPRADVDFLASIYGSLFNIFLAALYHALDALPNIKPSDVKPYISVLEDLQASGLLERFEVDIGTRVADLQDRVRVLAVHHYTDKSNDLHQEHDVNKALPLLFLTDILEKQAKLLDKRFPQPILGHLDLVSLVLESQIPLFLADLDNSRRALLEGSMNQQSPNIPIEDIFTLFRRTKTLLSMHVAFCPNAQVDFDLVGFFEPYVRQWLINTDSKTGQWVNTAINVDKFIAEGEEGHSSSIVDLFDSLRSPINFILDLEWPDEYQEARFFTALAKTISKSVEHYCRSIEDLFMTEMFPRPSEHLQPQKQSAWIEKAKQVVQGEKKVVEAFNFTPSSCVKLNNIEAARSLLDKMYNQMKADRLATILEEHGPPVPEKNERPRFLFTVKIVIAEGLVPTDGSPSATLDTFVTLSDEHGNRLAKTRTIYETLEPRWDETFDLSVENPLWLMASIRDRALVGKHDTVGRAYLCLDPRRFGDHLAHELWLDLDTQGRILLRVSMEGEKDDILFYFGRAFRSLKRAEGDMVRIFTDKMSPYVRQCLSRSVLTTLMKTAASASTSSGYDYNKALGNVTAFYRSAVGSNASDVMIPLPQEDKPSKTKVKQDDIDAETALGPLFEYLHGNLTVFNNSLSTATKEMVMTRVWKEILIVIEGLLVPPLSDSPSELKPLSEKEVDIVFQWLKLLLDFFYVDGEGPVPLEALRNQKYRDIMSIRLYYDWHTDLLMEECVRMMQQSFRSAPTMKKRAKTVYSQRNLGTIKDRKREKRKETEPTSAEVIMRILRMRPGTQDFLSQQLQIMSRIQTEQEQRAANAANRRSARRERSPLPPVPPLP